jgi:amino acid adenylation domain-containing protein
VGNKQVGNKQVGKATILDLIDEAASKHADGVAIESPAGETSYAELEKRSNALAWYLSERGVGRGSIVALLIEDETELIVAIVATLKAGAAFAPLASNHPPRRIEASLAEIAPRWIVAETKLLPLLDQAVGGGAEIYEAEIYEAEIYQVIAVGDPPSSSESELSSRLSIHFPESASSGDGPAALTQDDDLAYVYFSSGSTGRPKAIAGRVKGLSHFIRWEIKTFGIGHKYRISQLHPPSFDPFLRDIFAPLCSGGTVCVPPKPEALLEPGRLIEWIDGSRVNLVHIIPTLFRGIVNEELDAGLFASLKFILLAGEQLFPADVRKWNRVFNHRIQLVNLYGPTETTLAKFCHLLKPEDEDRRLIPIGKPMEGARALVLDEDLKICPDGTVGEIYIRTPFRTSGYYNRPDLTREVFIQNPFNNDPDDLIYKTGDMGRILDDGNFELLGRKDQQVKVRGVRIEMGEVEKLLRDYPLIKDACIRDWEATDKEKFLCAYYVSEKPIDESDLRRFLAAYLPDVAVPIYYIGLNALPRNLNGKIDRKRLTDPRAYNSAMARFVEPRTETEIRLSIIWQSVLQVEKVGVTQNFFMAGGHSLKATRLVSLINQEFFILLPLAALFEHPTIESLAHEVDGLICGARAELSPPPICPVPRQRPLPLSFAQHRLWFLDQLDPESSAYLQSVAIRLAGTLNRDALVMSLNEIVRRHEVLRTTFGVMDGQPVQVIREHEPLEIAFHDLAERRGEGREEEMIRLVNEEARAPVDLARGPVFRAKLARLSGEEHVLMISMHHIVSDAWSIHLMVVELSRLYQAALLGEPSPLAPLPVQYADFAVWQREWLKGAVLESQLDYWRKKLGGSLLSLDLPADKVRPPMPSYKGGIKTLTLSKEVLEALKSVSSEAGATLFMTVLAAFKVFLYKCAGASDVIVGTPVANRNRPEIEGLIGFFVNTLAIRTDLAGNPGFKDLLERVRESVLGALAHPDVPFEKIVEEIAPERSLSHSPIFQVVFALENASDEKLRLPGLTVSSVRAERLTSKFDLVMYAIETEQGLVLSAEYSSDLFEEATAEQMLGYFGRLLESIAKGPETRLDELEMLTDREAMLLGSEIRIDDFDASFSF